MELIERYIHEVGRYLPRKTRGDIQAELRSALLDALDAQDALDAPDENGVSQEQVVALLQEFGPPREVAASYQPQNQYLIGPELFPLFRLIVAIVLAALLGSLLLAYGISAIFNPGTLDAYSPLSLLEYVSDTFNVLVTAFGMVVIVFAILQRFGVRPELEDEAWDPRQLPLVPQEAERVDRRGTLIGVAFALAILAFLWFFPDKVGVAVAWGEGIIVNPVIVRYIPLISISLLLGITLDLIVLRQGRWSTGTRIAKIAVNLFSVYVLYVLLAGHNAWLAENGAGGFFQSLEALSGNILSNTQAGLLLGMQAFRLAFLVALIVISIETVGMIYRLIKNAVAPEPEIAPAA